MAGLLLILSIIDLKTFRLPNLLTILLTVTGLLQAHFILDQLKESILGAAIGFTIFVAIEILFKKIRGKDGLGRGDAKLLAGGGAWCGLYGLPFIVLIASGMGLIGALFPSIRENERIPFGPFLALGILIVWIALNATQLGIPLRQ
ncbi:MAG: prepilin peptidase [Hellea sp.]|nr:prepilin peptidase [Hellea sp.]